MKTYSAPLTEGLMLVIYFSASFSLLINSLVSISIFCCLLKQLDSALTFALNWMLFQNLSQRLMHLMCILHCIHRYSNELDSLLTRLLLKCIKTLCLSKNNLKGSFIIFIESVWLIQAQSTLGFSCVFEVLTY